MTRPTVYFIRHGETDWNAEARLQGQRDVPLNAIGQAQAAEAAGRLRALRADFADLDYVASPLGRTRETMERLRSALSLDPAVYRTDERLMELTFGGWEGLTWKEVRARDPRGAAGRERDKWGFTPPRGESYADLAERIAPAFAALSRDAVVVSHGGVARAYLALIAAAPREQAPRIDIWQGRILVLPGEGGFIWA